MDSRTWQPETDSFFCLFSIVMPISVLYKSFNISNSLLMARIPKPLSVSVTIPGPSSMMSITNNWSCKDNRIMISPVPRGAIPCLTAFRRKAVSASPESRSHPVRYYCLPSASRRRGNGAVRASGRAATVRSRQRGGPVSFRKSPALSATGVRSRSNTYSPPDWPSG